MIIVWGSRLYGKVDHVPGLFHVATKFGHLWYIPLIPMESYLVFAQDGKHFRGMKIGMSGKSILVAWTMAAAVVIGLIAGIMAIALGADHPNRVDEWLYPAIACAAAVAVLLVVLLAPGIRKATHARATALALKAGFTEEGLRVIDEAFNAPFGAVSGFPVVPAPAAPAAPTPTNVSAAPQPAARQPTAPLAAPPPIPTPNQSPAEVSSPTPLGVID